MRPAEKQDKIDADGNPAVGVIGGSGLYDMDALEEREEVRITTPFGDPSDAIVSGRLGGRKVCFLPRHGRGHRILPTELNHRANIYALRSLGVRFIIAVTAVGSLREECRPRDIVLPLQFFDRTSRREQHTFFGRGIVAHVAFGDPICPQLHSILADVAQQHHEGKVHPRGTYVNMDGPAFSTRAESELNRKMGFDVIGMTNVAEAKLAREAEISFATLAMVTDYDCWKVEEEPVNAQTVIGHLTANAEAAKKIVAETIVRIPEDSAWESHRSLDMALVTAKELWPKDATDSLQAILGRFMDR